jgi:hypothetical protein
MVSANVNTPLDRLRERWSDPLLTTLTVLLMLMLFVFAPFQAVGIGTQLLQSGNYHWPAISRDPACQVSVAGD